MSVIGVRSASSILLISRVCVYRYAAPGSPTPISIRPNECLSFPRRAHRLARLRRVSVCTRLILSFSLSLSLSLSSRRSLGYVPCLFAAIQGLSKMVGAACTNVRGGALSLSDIQRRAVVSRQRRASYCGCAGASCCVSSLSLSL